MPSNPGRPVGYIRSKIYNRSILNRTLIDSGNLFGDLISEEFSKLLKLPIIGKERTVGTAASHGKVTILGKTRSFKLYLEGITEAVTVHPYVVKDLAHPVNLGQGFLRNHNADMSFRENGVQLRIKSSSSMLSPSDLCLTRPSIDARIKTVLDRFKEEGSNPWSGDAEILDLRVQTVEPETQSIPGILYRGNKETIEFGNSRSNVCAREKTLIKAGHTTTVMLKRGRGDQPAPHPSKESNDVYLAPKMNNKLLNKLELFVHPGTYVRRGNEVKVQVSNLSSKDQYLPKHCNVGHILESMEHIPNGVNALDHRPNEELSEADKVERRSYIIDQLKLDENEILANKPEVKEMIVQIFMEHFDAIAINDADYGKTDMVRFQINIPPGTRPVRAKLRPLNPVQEKDLSRQIDAWLEAGVIEPSASAWSSALVPCKKKGSDKLRWALDYRRVNELSVKDAYPLASIETNLHKLSGTSIFSTLDSAGAFHTIAIDQESRDYTAFNTPQGQYRFCRLPFGLANAPSAYSRLVQLALNRLPPGFVLGYLDDLIVHSNNLEDHIDHLRQVVALHVNAGMKLNLSKCKLFQETVEYLGHLVSKDGIRMIPSYVERILDWPLPKTTKELRSFLGFCGYYRSFIKEFAHLTYEMNKMKTGKELKWTEATKEKFEKLKQCFDKQPLRGYPQYDNPQPFILDTDFSKTNMAAVLSQKQNGKEVFLGCVAKKCNKAESNYPANKGEVAAFVLGLKKFEHILRARKFILRTDSKCVEYLHNLKEFRGIWARWNNWICSFQFDKVHRAGIKQINADSLSRMPGVPESAEHDLLDPIEPFSDIADIYEVQNQQVQEITKEHMVSQTKHDPVLSRILNCVKLGEKPDKNLRKTFNETGMSYINVFECLVSDEDILYYQPPEVNGKLPPRRLCLPVSLQNLAFTMCHADPSGSCGHYGMNSTFRKMKQRFYFPHMYHFIAAKVNNCIPCIAKKAHMPKPSHAQHREELSYFGQRVYTDVVGPLSGSRYNGKICRYLLTIQDGYTRYLVAIPIEDQKTETIVKALIDGWIYTFGVMETLHSDNGKNFASNLYKEVMKQLGIVKTYTPIYSPSGNRVERSHRVLGEILRSDRRYDADKWTNKISAALLAYNASVNRYLGVSPYEAVFGRPVSLPIDLIFPFDQPEGKSWSNHIEDLKVKFSKLCQAICKHQQTGLMRENARFQGRNKQEFKEGDTCYYFLARVKRGLSRKLHSRWSGPWTVKRVVSESLVVIYPTGSWCENPKELAVIVNRLRKVEPRYAYSAHNSPSDNKIDLDIISDDMDDLAEFMSYQDDFEGEEYVTQPLHGPANQIPVLFPTPVHNQPQEIESPRHETHVVNNRQENEQLDSPVDQEDIPRTANDDKTHTSVQSENSHMQNSNISEAIIPTTTNNSQPEEASSERTIPTRNMQRNDKEMPVRRTAFELAKYKISMQNEKSKKKKKLN